jgi:hypothetical protein
MTEAGFEVRSAIMRLYYSFRGGDRPKNAEVEFPEVCVSPKGAYEPWMLFRKPIDTKTIAAAEAVGYAATGLELDNEYFRLAERAIPRLAALYPEFKGQAIDVELNGSVERDEPQDQLALLLAETSPPYKTRARRKRPKKPLDVPGRVD